MFICHDLCVKYQVSRKLYREGVKFCKVCSIYIKYEGKRCPCCSTLLRMRKHQNQTKVSKERFERMIVRY